MNWDNYYFSFAKLAASKSKDSTKVGAALVGDNGEVRLTGYNGPPRGVEDTPARLERPAKYLFASHAEANVIAFAARTGIRTMGCKLYTTHHPCAGCAKLIIQSGITCVHVAGGTLDPSTWGPDLLAATEMFREAGVEVITE